MKKILITIIVAFAASLCGDAKTTVIDFDYKKSWPVDNVWLDWNQNGEPDEGEAYLIEGTVSLDYKDFKTAGNILVISLRAESSEGKSLTYTARLSDITFAYTTSSDGHPTYFALNKLMEIEIGLAIENGKASVLVFNPAILEKR